jgi:hypothetical protein
LVVLGIAELFWGLRPRDGPRSRMPT